MSKYNKNWNLMDQVADVLEKRRRDSVAQRITSLTDKEQLQRSVYTAVTDEATANDWSKDERRCALAVLKELFDGNRVTLNHVLQGAEERFPGLPFAVCETFTQIVADRPDQPNWVHLPGIRRRLEESFG